MATSSSHLPAEIVVTDKPSSEVRKLTIAFSHWGTVVKVSTPVGATPLAKTTLLD